VFRTIDDKLEMRKIPPPYRKGEKKPRNHLPRGGAPVRSRHRRKTRNFLTTPQRASDHFQGGGVSKHKRRTRGQLNQGRESQVVLTKIATGGEGKYYLQVRGGNGDQQKCSEGTTGG